MWARAAAAAIYVCSVASAVQQPYSSTCTFSRFLYFFRRVGSPELVRSTDFSIKVQDTFEHIFPIVSLAISTLNCALLLLKGRLCASRVVVVTRAGPLLLQHLHGVSRPISGLVLC